ncbi:MAG TPA: FAD-containing oxidoreductase [Bryobacteraceae bacterium]|nr:FAD-containing oxidoreductase [Bryobacteraceae bacterium]
MNTHDAIIIGTGQAGPSLAQRLSREGMKIAVIERKLFGGTCVNTGCTPTKTLVASAYAIHLARQFCNNLQVDWKKLRARKDAVVAHAGVEKWMRSLPNCEVIKGHARFTAPHTVVVNDKKLISNRIFINVGARARIPAIPGLDQVPYLTNASIMDLDVVPPHLIILGGGPVGLEFAQMFRRFGSEVSIIDAGERLLPHEDEDVSAAVLDILTKEGVNVSLNAHNLTIKSLDNALSVHNITGSHLLVATGRVPNTDDLGLDKVGISTDDRGYIRVDEHCATEARGIWALGDCNGRGAFTHTSYNDYEIVAANLFDQESRRLSDRIKAYAVYIDPPLGRCGMTEAEVRKSKRPALIGRREMTKVSRAVEKGETQGFMKILVDAETRLILGASILGSGGDEAIHCILDTMYAGAQYTVLQRAVHIHPTVSELIPTMLGELKPL